MGIQLGSPQSLGRAAIYIFLVAIATFAADTCAAQNLTGSPDGAFPFLALPGTPELETIRTGIKIQWTLFSGINGSVRALYYLGMAGTLVGGIAIVFSKSLQDFKTLSSWLLLVVICLFGPYNSKLLFYEVPPPDPTIIKPDPTGANTFKGFTPQLVAMHMGTTLRVIFDDLFRSAPWGNITTASLAQSSLTETPGLDVQDYFPELQRCLKGTDRSLYPGGGQTNSGTNNIAKSETAFSDSLTAIQKYFERTIGDLPGPLKTIPPAIVLPTRATPSSADTASMRTLYSSLVGFAPSDAMSYGDMLTDLVGKANAVQADSLKTSAGFPNGWTSALFYVTSQDPAAIQQYQARASKLVQDCTGTLDSIAPGVAPEMGFVATESTPVCKDAVTNLAKQFKTPSTLVATGWGSVFAAATTDGRLPRTVQMNIPPSTVNTGVSVSPGPLAQTAAPADCGPNDRLEILKGAFNATLLKDMLGLRYMLFNNAAIPSSMTAADLMGSYTAPTSSWGAPAAQFKRVQALAQQVADSMNESRVRDALRSATSDGARQKFLIDFLTRLMVTSSEKGYLARLRNSSEALGNQPGQSAQPYAAKDLNPTLVGAVGGWFLGPIAKFFGSVGIVFATPFIGGIAIATIYFLKILLDIVTIVILIVTPIAFVLGLAMPNHALGVLIQSFMFVLVVKLTPVTFLIIDNVGTLIDTVLWSKNSGTTALVQHAMVLTGIAGMYTASVGMTLFLMFKLGDASGNVQKLMELDKAAEKAAETGMKIAEGLAKLTAAIGIGAAIGGVGALAAGKGTASAKAAALQAGSEAILDRVSPIVDARRAMKLGQNAEPVQGLPSDLLQPHEAVSDPALDEIDRELDKNTDAGDFHAEKIIARANENDLTGRAQTEAEKAYREYAQAKGENGELLGPEGEEAVAALSRHMLDNHYYGEYDGKRLPRRNPGKMSKEAAEAFFKQQGFLGSEEKAAQLAAASQAGSQSGTPTVQSPAGGLSSNGMTATGPISAQIGEMNGGQVSQASGSSPASGTASASSPIIADDVKVEPTAKDLAHEQERIRRRIIELSGRTPDELVGINMAHARAMDAAQQRGKAESAALNAASIKPGMWRSAMAGAVGGLLNSGGVGQIPVLGELVKVGMSQWIEAPERARIWADPQGGFWTWFKAQSNAQRKQALEKEASTLGSGYQYQEIGAMGAYDGLIKAAVKAASEAAGKVRDERTAYRLSAKDLKGDMNARLTAEDFRGATLINALQSLETTLQSSVEMRTGKVRVEGGDVAFNPRVLKELTASKATKDVSGSLEGLLSNHYYLNEKDNRASYGTSRRTRGDRDSITKFIMEDLDTDYRVGGLQKLFRGKESFMQALGDAQGYWGARMIEEVLMAKKKVELEVEFRGDSKRVEAELKNYKGNMPIQRVHNMAIQRGFGNAYLSSVRGRYVQEEREEMFAQERRMAHDGRYSIKWDRGGIDQVNKAIQNAFKNISIDVDEGRMRTILSEIVGTRQDKARAMRLDRHYLAEVVEEALERMDRKNDAKRASDFIQQSERAFSSPNKS